jgi:ribosome assembly protein YihI (activator of Der GTPase)
MEQNNALYALLIEYTEIYENAVKLEYEKYDASVKNDIVKLNEVISKEQVFYLKMKGLEQKREKLTLSMKVKDKSLKEIIELYEGDNKIRLKSECDRLNKALVDFKKINNECKTIIDIRLHRINNVMSKLGQKENTYTNNSKHSNIKSNILSKKI